MKLFVLMAYPVYMAEGAGLGRVRAVMNPAVFRAGKLSFASAATDRNLTCVGCFSPSVPPLSVINGGRRMERCPGLCDKGGPLSQEGLC